MRVLKFLALVVTLCFFQSAPVAAQPDRFTTLAAGGSGGWLNVTRPLTVGDMAGRLVLLDFWTYGCINCMQVIPDLEYLEHKFGDRLLIIGVHSAKFDGEKGNSRILAAAKRFGLKHPVINDADFSIWKSYKVRAWPTLILLDGQGREISRFEGEGHRAAMDTAIEKSIGGATAATPLADIIAADADQSVLSFPARLAAGAGLLFVADSGHNRILGFDEDGKIQVTIGAGERGAADGIFSAAQFNQPRGLVFLNDALYIADTGNHLIRRADLTRKTVETVAGTGVRGRIRDAVNAPAKTTPIASPWDVEDMGDGKTLAIAMAGLHQLWTLDTKAGTLSVLAGNGREDIADGPAATAEIAQTSGLSRVGNTLFFVDAESSSLRMLDQGRVSTLIGTGLFDFGDVDGQYPAAMLQHPQGLYAGETEILIADTYNNDLRRYDRATKTLSTVPLTGAALNEPGDILVLGGAVYLTDTNNHRILKIDRKAGAMTPLILQK
ncbi:MAG: thioredoxin-like domain-containing protein [Micavibrio sp.]